VTLADRQLIEAWGRRAQLQLQLEIDRRFDHLGEWLEISAWPGVE
jgi:hypothetical protein